MNENAISWLIPRMKGSILLAGEDLFVFSGLLGDCPDTDCVKKKAVEEGMEGSYDWILLGGLFEKTGPGQEEKVKLLGRVRKCLKKTGRLVLLTWNRLGLSGFAGMPDACTGRFFDGVEGYPEEKNGGFLVSRPVLEAMLKTASFSGLQFYYPYPDLNRTEAVYSDSWLPAEGAFAARGPVPAGGRLRVFREEAAFDAVARDGLFPVFANSFLVLAGPASESLRKEKAADEKGTDETGGRCPVRFVKYSDRRDARFRIRTEAESFPQKAVIKYPLNREAENWVLGLKKKEEQLLSQLSGTPLQVNRCSLRSSGACFEWAEGCSIESELDGLLRSKDEKAFTERIREVFRMLEKTDLFRMEDGFREVFGDASLLEGGPQAVCPDADLIFANLLRSGDGYTVIDYEWTFPFPLPAAFLKYRCVHYYVNGNSMRRRTLSEEQLLDLIPLKKEERDLCVLMEEQFQKWIRGEKQDENNSPGRTHAASKSMNCAAEGPVVDVTSKAVDGLAKADRWESWVRFVPETDAAASADSGTEIRIRAWNEGRLSLRVPVPEGTGQILLSPCLTRCVFRLEKLEGRGADGMPVSGEALSVKAVGGRKDGNGDYIFDTDQPQLDISGAGLRELIVEGRGEAMEGLLRDAVLAQSGTMRRLTQSKLWKLINRH